MVPVALQPIVPSTVCNAIDRVIYHAVPSKTRRRSLEADIRPSLVGAGLDQDISAHTATLCPPETLDHAQPGSVEKPMPTADCPADDYRSNCPILSQKSSTLFLLPESVGPAEASRKLALPEGSRPIPYLSSRSSWCRTPIQNCQML